MRVTPDQLVVDSIGDVGDRESALLLGDRCVELDLVEQVAEFLDQVGIGIGTGIGIGIGIGIGARRVGGGGRVRVG